MHDTKAKIQHLIASDPLEAISCLHALIKHYQDNSAPHALQPEYDGMILTKGQFITASEDYGHGLISRDEKDRTFQRVRKTLLDTLNDIPQAVFEIPGDVQEQLFSNNLQKDQVSEKAAMIARQSHYEYDVFFSFSSQNIAEARNTVAKLRGYGLRVFFSDESLKNRVGESFGEMINHALENSNHFVWYCTPESTASTWVRLEFQTFFNQIHLADQQKRRFFILRGRDFDMKLVPLIYRNLQFADDEEQIINNLPKDLAGENERAEEAAAERQRLAVESKIAEIKLEEQRQRLIEEMKQAKALDNLEKKRAEEQAAQQRLAEEKKRAEELAVQQRLAEEKKRAEEQAVQQRLAEEKKRAEEQAVQQRLAEEKKRAEEQAVQQRLAEEKKRAEEQAVQVPADLYQPEETGLPLYFTISAVLLFCILNYSIRFKLIFDYEFPSGFWTAISVFSILPTLILGIGLYFKEQMAEKFYPIFSLVILLELVYPLYNVYGFKTGLIKQAEVINTESSDIMNNSYIDHLVDTMQSKPRGTSEQRSANAPFTDPKPGSVHQDKLKPTHSDPPPVDDKVVSMFDINVLPGFPGGDAALLKYLQSKIQYPPLARENNVAGTVAVKFIVEKDGSLSNIQVIKDIGAGCGKEAVRVVVGMPKWSPGKNKRGEPVRVEFTLPVRFKLE